jgi:hypothetical protein
MLTWVIDLRTTLLPPRDQGSRPTCLSWAVTAAHEFGLPDGRLSIEYLHWNSGNYAGDAGPCSLPLALCGLKASPTSCNGPTWNTTMTPILDIFHRARSLVRSQRLSSGYPRSTSTF